jgi:hypothetical protein
MVGAGKDRSGFHGTTIQAVYSKPSEKNLQVELVSAGFEDTSAVATIINSDSKHLQNFPILQIPFLFHQSH